MLVSAVIIFFNEERFLEEAIESVRAQTYTNWELLLVDDGSTDGSSACARRHAAAEPGRVRYLEHPGRVNLGMSAARNLGIRGARGEVLAFLDADDVWRPDKLEHQVGLLSANRAADMIWGRTYYWYSWTGRTEDKELDHIAVFPAGLGGLVSGAPLRAFCFQGAPPSNCASLFRTDFVRGVGGWDASFRGLFEDQVFWAKATAVGKAYIDDKCVARYRMHPDSSCYTALREGSYHASRKRYLDWAEAYWRTLDFDDQSNTADDPALSLLRHELWRYRHPWRSRLRAAMESLRSTMSRQRLRTALMIRRIAHALSAGSEVSGREAISAEPNPIPVRDCHASHRPRGLTTLTWRARSATELRRGAPDGEPVAVSLAGDTQTARVWAEDGSLFYLQDTSDGKSPTFDHTLDMVRIRLRLLGKLVAPW